VVSSQARARGSTIKEDQDANARYYGQGYDAQCVFDAKAKAPEGTASGVRRYPNT